jgi:hypothetical protein
VARLFYFNAKVVKFPQKWHIDATDSDGEKRILIKSMKGYLSYTFIKSVQTRFICSNLWLKTKLFPVLPPLLDIFFLTADR